MRNILIFSVRCLAAGHCDSIPVFAFKYFDVMHHESFIDGDRYYRFELACGIADFPYTNIINLHNLLPLENSSLYSLY